MISWIENLGGLYKLKPEPFSPEIGYSFSSFWPKRGRLVVKSEKQGNGCTKIYFGDFGVQ